jgi:hypothetical protein
MLEVKGLGTYFTELGRSLGFKFAGAVSGGAPAPVAGVAALRGWMTNLTRPLGLQLPAGPLSAEKSSVKLS